MNTTLGLRRRHHITKVGLSLLILALIAGMAGCAAGSSSTVRYDLTIDSAQGGSVDIPGEGTFTCDAGRVVDLAAIPTSGYRFVNWTGDVDTVNNPYAASTTVTVNGDYSITANFEQTAVPYYTLTTSVSPSGGGSVSPSGGTYAAGSQVTLTAMPASGYSFSNWGGDTSGSQNPINITMNSNKSITAYFVETGVTYYALTTTVSPSGGGSVSPAGGTYAAGSQVTLTATPASGYSFSHWGGDASGSQNPITITMNSNKSITAYFEETGVTYYTLTTGVSPSGGGSASPAGGTYAAGSQVAITAIPASGYSFSHWGGDASGSQNPITITMNSNKSITAYFTTVQYTLTTSVSPAGGGSVSPAGGTYAAGSQVTLTAIPASGYSFSHWGGHASGSQNPITITMNSNKSITAYFTTVQYTLTTSVSPSGGGSVSPAGGTYAAGSQVTLTAMPASGYSFSNWGGDASGSQNPITITMNSNKSITAYFEETGETFMVAAGERHTVGLKSDGTVVAVGDNAHGQCDVDDWENIIQVAAGGYHTVGLKSDGTVVAVGYDYYGQCDVGDWTNIKQVAAGAYHTVGLKYDGTVVAVGYAYWWQCNVGGWTNIVQVAAGGYHTVGLKSDLTVLAAGYNYHGQCDVSSWTNIVQVAAGGYHTVGLRSNGNAVAVGDNGYGQCNVGGWANIMQVAAGGFHTVGRKTDGTAVAVGYNYHGQCDVSSWTSTIQVTAGAYHTVGLKADGTVIAMGANWWGQCDVGGWDLN
jgi:hypothetical protein